jgi:hypothetical protein
MTSLFTDGVSFSRIEPSCARLRAPFSISYRIGQMSVAYCLHLSKLSLKAILHRESKR